MDRALIVFVIALLRWEVSAAALEPRITDAPDLRNAVGQPSEPQLIGLQATKLGLRPRDPNEIFARAASTTAGAGGTCGYASQDTSSPIACASGYGCVFWGAFPIVTSEFNLTLQTGAVDCCEVFTGATTESYHFRACEPLTRCVDYRGSALNNQSTPVTTSGVQYCPSNAPSCGTYEFLGAPRTIYATGTVGSSEAAATFTNLFCGDDSTVIKVYQDVTNGEITTSTAPVVPSISSLSSTSSTATSGPGSSSSSSSSQSSSKGGSSTNVGVIAGATVGGFVGVAAIAAGLAYLIWRKKRQRISAPPEVSQFPY